MNVQNQSPGDKTSGSGLPLLRKRKHQDKPGTNLSKPDPEVSHEQTAETSEQSTEVTKQTPDVIKTTTQVSQKTPDATNMTPVSSQMTGHGVIIKSKVVTKTKTVVSPEPQVSEENTIIDVAQTAVEAARNVYLQELTRNRKLKKRTRKRVQAKHDHTPRLPKPVDLASDGYNYRDKAKPVSLNSLTSGVANVSSDSLFKFRPESGGSARYSFASEFSGDSLDREASRASITSVSSTREPAITSGDLANSVSFMRPYELGSQGDPLHELQLPTEVASGTSTSNIYTKQKLMYSRFERRPQSETIHRVTGKPPLPPGALNKIRPASETIRSSQSYSRHLADEPLLIEIN